MIGNGVDRSGKMKNWLLLLGLTLISSLAAGSLGYTAWQRGRRAVTTAYLEVKSDQPAVTLSMLRDPLVAEDTLRAPGISQLSIVSQQSDQATWLTNYIESRISQKSPIVELRVVGFARHVDDDRRLLGAFIEAFRSRMAGQGVESKVIQKPLSTTH
jgi:hypothetical protein